MKLCKLLMNIHGILINRYLTKGGRKRGKEKEE
jgi:hypothetical protein